MREKVNRMCVSAYLGVTGFFRGLKEDQRGLSGIVVAVLLILVAVLAVVLLWGSLKPWLTEMWEKIAGKAGEIN